ncbi:hypothetical protein [Microbacterium halotolerans]|uniref:hypothetical protein n=1 Tax=Microbacterium halotolerans TaxID=246613 RepID=UPI000E6A9CE1|nr:hypothetical protein [Microbacterium halotolerans]
MNIARSVAALGLVALVAAGAAACAPEPGAEHTEEPGASAPDTSPSETSVPESTPEPAGFEMPADCASVYTDEMFDVLDGADGFQLNDPSLTMLSSEVVGALELLDQVDPLRCTWGVASETGIATTVAEIDDAQADALRTALEQSGFTCTDGEPEVCSLKNTINGDAGQAESTETHVFGGGGWAATRELNSSVEPEYSESIAAALWS